MSVFLQCDKCEVKEALTDRQPAEVMRKIQLVNLDGRWRRDGGEIIAKGHLCQSCTASLLELVLMFGMVRP